MWQLVLLALLAAVVAVACGARLPGRGSYPLDIFYEMHYQQSYKSHEPPRLSGVADAVPWFPAPKYTAFEANSGRYLFAVNCSICHGPGAKGDGPVLQKLITTYGYTPVVTTDLTTLPPEAIESFLRATTRPFGPDSVMPPFGKLLSAEERGVISQYIGTLPK